MWTLKLLRVNQMPSDFQEPYIVNKYRCSRSTFLCCLKSMFQQTNETINFWTHFCPFLYFLWRLINLSAEGIFNENYTWPLFAFMVSVCCYLLGSCTAHLFNCISEHARHVCFYFDYAAISLYSVGAAIAYRQYVFPNEMIGGWYYSLFHYIAAFNSVVCTTMACTSRFGNREILKKILRLSAFAYPYVFDSIPLVIRLTSCHSNDCWDESYELHARQFFLAFITASFFASHFPECIAPGMFDVIGHSHQLFHICGALATNTQLNALMLDMENRREFFEQHDAMPTFFSSLGLFGIVIIMNLIIVAIFSYFRKYPLVFKEMTGSALYRIASSAQLFALNNNNNKKSL